MKTPLLILTSLFLSLFSSLNSNAQIEINTSFTIEDLVNEFFNSGDFISVTNISFNGNYTSDVGYQIGAFTNAESADFIMDTGLIMGTNDVHTFTADTFLNMLSLLSFDDPDMLSISQGSAINDCAILEFDAIVEAPIVAFEYSFGSKEYPGFTCSMFNDAFGLFVSGPGIDGPYSNAAVNIATIPNSETPVSINTLNSGVSTNPGNEALCENLNPNWQEDSIYFIDNNPPGTNSDINLPGYTVPLEAILEVTQGETYHFKFAICDVLDQALDSGIFLAENSLEGRFPVSVNNFESEDFILYPNPTQNELRVKLPGNLNPNSTLRVFSSDGRQLRSETIRNNEDILLEMANLDRGVYFLEIDLENQAPIIKKFVKE